ncbi:MAG: DEAD/DEAH box helicase [Bacillota bacterium]
MGRTERYQENLLRVERTFEIDGMVFDVWVERDPKHRELVELPLTQPLLPPGVMLAQSALPKLSALQELWMNSVIDDGLTNGTYVLKYDRVDEVSDDLCAVLEVPSRESLAVHIESHLAVGNPSFALEVSMSHPRYGRLSPKRRKGHALQVGSDSYILIERPLAELLDRLEHRPTTVEGQFAYVAEVKALALKAGASLDEYLRREEYAFPERVSVDVQSKSPDEITLIPQVEDLPEGFEPADVAGGYAVRTDERGRRRRVFLSPKAKANLQAMAAKPSLKGPEVPQFIGNPQAFLPESLDLDLEKFSDRVKSLGIRAYKAKPYIQVTPRANGWFDIEVGVRTEDVADRGPGPQAQSGQDEGAGSAEQLSPEELGELSKDATPEGGWVLRNGQWIHVPKDAGKFAEAARRLEEIAPDGRVAPNMMRYVLEIYTNIEALEYDSEFNRLAREFLGQSADLDDRTVPACFCGQLRDYQTDGYVWMRRISQIPLGGLLADEMGLGKTVQVIAFMSWLNDRGLLRPSLVVGPQALVDNWASELGKFLPGVSVYKHMGPGRVRDMSLWNSVDIVATTYDTLVRDEIMMGQIDWRVLVCDEAQRIKNFTTATARVVKAMKAGFRLALTGTPVENSLGDLWSIVDYVQPGLLGSYQEFRQRFEIPLSQNDTDEMRAAVEKKLVAHLYLVYKRRTKEEYLRELPPKTECVDTVPMSPLQQQRYAEIVAEAKRGDKGRGVAFVAIRRLLNTCAHPYLETGGFDTASPEELIRSCPKLARTMEILEHVKRSEEKALVFTDRRNMQRILARAILGRFGIYPAIINGESINRFDSVKHFNMSQGFNVLILSPRAAGVGLTITGANHVIHYTRWWNPAVENQATDRAHRIGQTRPVTVHIPIVTSPAGRTAEQVLDTLLKRKRALASSVIVPSSRLNVTEEEIARELGLVGMA